MMKKILFLLLTVAGSWRLHAQFSMPTYSRISTPYGNVNVQTGSICMPMYYGVESIPNKKYDYEVVLKNDSSFIGHGKINMRKSVHSIKLKSETATREFRPSETKRISRIMEGGAKMSGIPYHDSCWLFKTESGKINLFAVAPEPYTPFASAMQIMDTGKIEIFNKEEISNIVKDNPKAAKKAKKGKLYEAIELYNRQN